jgi:hypothetical protein
MSDRPIALLIRTMLLVTLCAVAARAAEPEAPEVIRKGGVRYYVKEKRIEIDGKFCLEEGPIELLACARGGKEYESVITLDVNPEILHFCLILMGLKPGKTGPRFQGDPKNAPTGSPVIVRVRWKMDDDVKLVRGEDLCWNAIDKRPMRRTPWVFVGSRKHKDPDTGKKVYWANVERSVLTVYWDPYSVLDLPLALGSNDEAYVVNKRLVPKVGTPCTVLLTPGPVPPPLRNEAGARIYRVNVSAGGRVLIDDDQPEDLVKVLHEIHREAPKASCRVTLDHGAPADAAVRAFEGLAEVAIPIESVRTVRVRKDVRDAVTLAVTDDAVRVKGKVLPANQLREVMTSFALGGKPFGVAVRVEKGARLKTVVQALKACVGVKPAVVRIIWHKEDT